MFLFFPPFPSLKGRTHTIMPAQTIMLFHFSSDSTLSKVCTIFQRNYALTKLCTTKSSSPSWRECQSHGDWWQKKNTRQYWPRRSVSMTASLWSCLGQFTHKYKNGAKNMPSLPAVTVLLSWQALTIPTFMPGLIKMLTWRQWRGSRNLRQNILKFGGLTAQSMQRGAHYLLVLTNTLITLDANCVSYSATRAGFVVLAGLININFLGL